MRTRSAGIFGVVTFVFLTISLANAKDDTYTGEIMDSQCAKEGSHATMMKKHDIKTEKECTNGCAKMGGKYVLYDSSAKRVYELDDQKKGEQFAGEKVKVTGTYDKASKTLHVTDISGAS
jgi:hypothetical protein